MVPDSSLPSSQVLRSSTHPQSDQRSDPLAGERIRPHKSLEHWAIATARVVLERFPNKSEYVCAAGISPSGTVHFGNLRDVITSVTVARALRDLGVRSKVLFSWDDFDRLRKVPSDAAPGLAEHLGKPLCDVPHPNGGAGSYAQYFEREFEGALKTLNFDVEFRYQSAEYRKGRYRPYILQALQKREAIAEILLENMSEKALLEKQINPSDFIKSYFPITVYSRFNGTDDTQIISFDGSNEIRYLCKRSGQEDTISLDSYTNLKLPWKIDWPMRWGVENVVFEPGGHDHASPGGSYDAASKISRIVFDRSAPLFLGYEFIGLAGGDSKMSSSRGGAVSPATLLDVYEPAVLNWLYTRKSPDQRFVVAINSEVVRQYEEFDREVAAFRAGTLSSANKSALIFATEDTKILAVEQTSLPFRQAVGLGQLVQWDPQRLNQIINMLGLDYARDSIERRLDRARNWLENHNPEQRITLLDTFNSRHFEAMSEEAQSHVRQLVEQFPRCAGELLAVEKLVYSIPKIPNADSKENSKRQRSFFADVYSLLLGKDTGPRLGTFLWILGPKSVLPLLSPSPQQQQSSPQ